MKNSITPTAKLSPSQFSSEARKIGERSTAGTRSGTETRRPHDVGGSARSSAHGLSFPILVKQGDPTPNQFPSGLTRSEKMQRWQWIYRLHEELRCDPGQSVWFHTFTFRVEPDLDEARRAVQLWIKRARKWHTNVQRPAVEELCQANVHTQKVMHREFPTFRYLVAMERGSLGRLHAHVITISPWRVRWRDWDSGLLLWTEGFKKHNLVKPQDGFRGAVAYICKYITKDTGRILCNSKFGSTTLTMLCGSSSFKALLLANMTMAQSLLRRLSLSRNYPTSKWISSWISRDSSLTVSRPRQSVPLRPIKMLGETGFGKAENEPRYDSRSPEYRAACRGLVRGVIAELRQDSAGPMGRAIKIKLPGLASFGRPKKLVQGTDTALWFAAVAHPLCARRRSQANKVCV